MNSKKTISFVSLAFMLSLVSGCSTLVSGRDKYNNIKDIEHKASTVQSARGQKQNLLEHTSKIYVERRPIKVSDNKALLMAAYPNKVVFSEPKPQALGSIAEAITTATKIPVSFLDLSVASQKVTSTPASTGASDARGAETGGSAGLLPSLSNGSMPSSAALSGLLSGINGEGKPIGLPDRLETALNSSGQGGAGVPGFPDMRKLDIRFSGNLPDFLDMVTERLNLFWRYDADMKRIVIHQFDTQTFQIYAMPGDIKVAHTVNNSSTSSSGGSSAAGSGGSASGGTSKSGQAVELNSDMKTWDDISSSVANMLSSKGRAYGNTSLGTMTVTDTPVVLAGVKRYIDDINKMMGRQVELTVQVYNVELNQDNKAGVDWNIVWQRAQDYGLTYAVPASAVPDGVNGLQAKILNPNSVANGSSLMARALESLGRVGLQTEHSVLTLNNTPAPVKVADETTYLASSGGASPSVTGSTPTSVISTTLMPGKVVAGITMTLTPRIVDGTQMMLQFAIDLSTLKSIDTITSGTQSIQAPKLGMKSFLQRVSMSSGETLMLTGFNSNEDTVNNTGTFDIPGSLTVGGKKTMTVIMITPRVTEGII